MLVVESFNRFLDVGGVPAWGGMTQAAIPSGTKSSAIFLTKSGDLLASSVLQEICVSASENYQILQLWVIY